jgi:hypothetical protein
MSDKTEDELSQMAPVGGIVSNPPQNTAASLTLRGPVPARNEFETDTLYAACQ